MGRHDPSTLEALAPLSMLVLIALIILVFLPLIQASIVKVLLQGSLQAVFGPIRGGSAVLLGL